MYRIFVKKERERIKQALGVSHTLLEWKIVLENGQSEGRVIVEQKGEGACFCRLMHIVRSSVPRKRRHLRYCQPIRTIRLCVRALRTYVRSNA